MLLASCLDKLNKVLALADFNGRFGGYPFFRFPIFPSLLIIMD